MTPLHHDHKGEVVAFCAIYLLQLLTSSHNSRLAPATL